MQTCTSSFLQTNLEFFRVLRLGSVLQLQADDKNVKETSGVKKKKGAGRIQTRAQAGRINVEADAACE